MKAELIFHDKVVEKPNIIVEVRIWKVPPSSGKAHGYKYSFAYIKDGRRIIGYDNAEGKGDHRHYKDKEEPYKFRGIDKLFRDFYKDIRGYKNEG